MINNMMLLLFLLFSEGNGYEMLVRVYTDDYHKLSQIELKSLDIAGRKYQEYFDIVVTPFEYNCVLSSGLRSEIITDNLGAFKEEFRGEYHSYNEVTSILRNYVDSFPLICKLDSIGLSYEGRWVYALKISDEPWLEDPTEPGVLFDGLHHAREWATVEVVLFYADTLTMGYGTDPVITDLINNNEIWLIPIVNVDGYSYDYPGEKGWRKNRKPYLGSIGTDPNRNYNGAVNGDPYGDWCSVPAGGSMSNCPWSNVFCGAYSGFADVVSAMMEFHRKHDINANITYHSYAEEIIWPWAYTSSKKTPDSTAYEAIANAMATRIQGLGGGNYLASGSLYPNTGTTRSWVYGYHHFVKGTSCLSYTIEVGTSFYQPQGDLDNIAHENWEGALYLALRADSIREFLLPDVPAPEFSLQDTVYDDSVTLYWTPVSEEWTHPDRWQLDQLDDYAPTLDSIESGTDNWLFTGFAPSSTRKHSGDYSLFSGSGNNIANVAITKYPYLVREGDSLSFWCWYNLEGNYDVTAIEVSKDQKEWIQLDERYSDTSGGWVQKKYSLEHWVDMSLYIRFRTVTDGNTLMEGFYVDDIYPVPNFGSVSIIDSAIIENSYTVEGLSQEDYYFRVRGHNNRGWGSYSDVEGTSICSGVTEEKGPESQFYFSATTDLKGILISYEIDKSENVKVHIYDISGRKIKEINRYDTKGKHSLRIKDCKNGIWFVRLETEERDIVKKVVVIR